MEIGHISQHAKTEELQKENIHGSGISKETDNIEIPQQNHSALVKQQRIQIIKQKLAAGFYLKNPDVDSDLTEKMANLFKHDFSR